MLESLPLFNFLKVSLVSVVFFISPACSCEEKKLSYESLQNSEELVQYIQNGVSEERLLAEELYQSSLKRKVIKNNWGAVSKYFVESALIYPTAKSLIGLSESQAFFYTHSRFGDAAVIKTLGFIENYLEGAVAIEEIQQNLSIEEIAKINSDINCISKFLSSRKKESTCKYVAIIYSINKK